jgi:hypothetical protein
MLLISSVALVITTLVKGFEIEHNPFFLLAEIVLNILILGDFICRVKVLGVKRYLSGGWWNILDIIVVLGCIIMFILMMISKSGSTLAMEEISEELLLIIWSVFQAFRMIMIAKKQKQA